MWQRDGQRVEFRYTGNDEYYQGLVESSRVKYGGTVQHCVKLDQPVVIYGTKRTHLLVDEPDIIEVVPQRGDICVLRSVNGTSTVLPLADQHTYKEWAGCFSLL